MGINLGSGFGNLTGNSNSTSQTGGILNLNKNDILDLTKRNPGLKRVKLGAGWDISNNGFDFDLDIAAFLLDSNNKFNTVSNVIFFNNKEGQGISLAGDNRTGAGEGDDETINIDLENINPNIAKIVFVVTIHEAMAKRQTFGMINNSYVRLIDLDQNEFLTLLLFSLPQQLLRLQHHLLLYRLRPLLLPQNLQLTLSP